MGKVFNIPAGTRTRVLWLWSSSVPGQIRFNVEMADGGPIAGEVEIARQRWFTWYRDTLPLKARNSFDKSITEGDYRIHVTPERDCRVTFETRHFRAGIFFAILAAVLILGLISGMTAFLFAPPGTPAG